MTGLICVFVSVVSLMVSARTRKQAVIISSFLVCFACFVTGIFHSVYMNLS